MNRLYERIILILIGIILGIASISWFPNTVSDILNWKMFDFIAGVAATILFLGLIVIQRINKEGTNKDQQDR